MRHDIDGWEDLEQHPAGIVVGGLYTPGYSASALVEEYNGSAWTEIADIPARAYNWRYWNSNCRYKRNWKHFEGTVYELEWNIDGQREEIIQNLRTRTNASGTQTATLAQGGAPPPGSYSNVTAEYNGSCVGTSRSLSFSSCKWKLSAELKQLVLLLGGYNPGTTVDG